MQCHGLLLLVECLGAACVGACSTTIAMDSMCCYNGSSPPTSANIVARYPVAFLEMDHMCFGNATPSLSEFEHYSRLDANGHMRADSDNEDRSPWFPPRVLTIRWHGTVVESEPPLQDQLAFRQWWSMLLSPIEGRTTEQDNRYCITVLPSEPLVLRVKRRTKWATMASTWRHRLACDPPTHGDCLYEAAGFAISAVWSTGQ